MLTELSSSWPFALRSSHCRKSSAQPAPGSHRKRPLETITKAWAMRVGEMPGRGRRRIVCVSVDQAQPARRSMAR